MRTYRVGTMTVDKVEECTLPFAPRKLLPAWDAALVGSVPEVMTPGFMDDSRENLVISVHSWLVRDGHRTVLIDTGIGNGKSRASPMFDGLETPYLDRLAVLGVAPEAVTHVLITHVHTDHVGWNTRRQGDRWIATFPRARHVVPEAGLARFAKPEARERSEYVVYADSLLPVIEAGLVDPVGAGGGEALDGFTFEPTPGHSVDHMSIRLRSEGAEALFTGDIIHHPVQVVRPECD